MWGNANRRLEKLAAGEADALFLALALRYAILTDWQVILTVRPAPSIQASIGPLRTRERCP